MTVTLPPHPGPVDGLDDRVPARHPDRWRLHRAGITNVWYYYDNEFDFSGGRMILRGTNGSGKSRALEMLLPFLLDADRRRMDSTGSGTVKLETLMRYGGEEQPNRLGYLWLELTRDNEGPEYLTVAALIRYSSSTKRVTVWYFITPLRVGENLLLLDANRHPLGLKNLTDLIGEENLTESPTIHSDRVAQRVFGLTGQSGKERYSGLLQLLHTLRSPDVGNRIEDNKLAKILSEALPPLSDHALDTAGSHLDSLSEARQAQQDLVQTQAQVRAFMATYRRYVRTLLSAAISAVEQQAGTVRTAAKAAHDLRRETKQFSQDARTEAEQADHLASAAGDLRADIDGWTKLPVYQAGLQLEGLEDQAAALLNALTAQINAGASARENETVAVGAANRSADELTRAVAAAEGLRAACRENLMSAGVPVGALPGPLRSTRNAAETPEELVRLSADDTELVVRPRPDVLTVSPEDLDTAATAVANLKESSRQRAAAAMNRLGTASKLLHEQTEVERADEVASSAEGAAADAEAAAVQTADKRDDTARSLAIAWRTWTTSTTTRDILGEVDWSTSPVAGLLLDLEALVGDSQEPSLDQLDQAAQAAAGPARLRLAALLTELDRAEHDDERRRQELEAEQAALRSDKDPEPEAVPWARTMPADAVPFWRCVDFTADADADESARGAIEAALQASGLLTAALSADTALTAADGQVLVTSTSERAQQPVTTLLRPDAESPVAADIVEDVLSRIGLGPGGNSTWVDVDGRWRNGPLTGRYLADRPRHIGAAARQAAREARLAEIAIELDALDRATDARRDRRAAVESDVARLDSHVLTKPPSGELANLRWAAQTSYQSANDARDEATQARNAADQKRRVWVQESDEHRRLCDHGNLPHTVDELADVERTAGESAARCGELVSALGTIVARRDSHREDLARVDTATSRRLGAEGEVHGAWRRWRDVAQQLERIREDFGTGTEEIMRRIAEAKRQAGNLEGRAEAGRIKAQGFMTKAAVAESQADQADLRVQQEQEILADAVAHLRTQLTLPGVVEAATHGRSAAGSDDIQEAVRLVTDLGEESPGQELQRTCRQLRETIEAGDKSAPVDENDLLKAQQTLDRELSSSFDTVLSVVEGVRLFELIDADGRFPVALAARRLDERVEQARAALSDREYTVFSEYVVGGVADELRRRLGDADQLVKAMDETLKGITTSQGIRVRLKWELLHEDTSDIGRIRTLCLKSSAFRSKPDTDELIQLLKERVTAEFETDPAAGYVAALEAALDYRQWHHIVVKITRPGHEDTAVDRRSRLSQGERRFVSYVVLFAAADTYFSSLPEADRALRLITLDDAFAKVDDRTIAELLGLLVRLDLDFCLTGHALWGTYPEVPALDVYEVRRETGTPAVTTHVHWDGKTRYLRPV